MTLLDEQRPCAHTGCPMGLDVEIDENREVLAAVLDRIVALEETAAGLQAELDHRAVTGQLLGSALSGFAESLEALAKALCMPS